MGTHIQSQIKASELRIGNYVNVSFKNIDRKGDYQIIASQILDIFANGDKSSFVYKPIPLTEEWLLKFGFFKDERYGDKVSVIEIKKHKEFILMFDDMDKSYFLCDTDVDTCLKHVHQLQNLYFALTGEELTIK